MKNHSFASLPLLAISGILLLNALSSLWLYANTATAIDFYTWWSVPHVLSNSTIDNIYSLDGQKELLNKMRDELAGAPNQEKMKAAFSVVSTLYQGRLETTATPFFYAGFGVLQSGDYVKDAQNFTLISLTCIILSAIIVCIILRVPVYFLLMFLAVFFTTFLPFSSELRVDNINRIQLFLLSLFLLLFVRSKHSVYATMAGLVLGLTIMWKPNLIMILFFIMILNLAQKEYRKSFQLLAGAFFGAVLAFSASIAYFHDIRIWAKWLAIITTRIDYYYPLATGNVSLIKMLYDIYGIRTGLLLQVMLAVMFAFYILYLKRYRRPMCETLVSDGFMVYGLGCIYVILSSGLVWLHYYTLLLPLYIYLIGPLPNSVSNGGVSTVVAKFLSCLSFLMLTTFAFVVSPHSEISSAIVANAAIIILLLAFMLQCAQVHRPLKES